MPRRAFLFAAFTALFSRADARRSTADDIAAYAPCYYLERRRFRHCRRFHCLITLYHCRRYNIRPYDILPPLIDYHFIFRHDAASMLISLLQLRHHDIVAAV